jgi:GT2 family glycosyltransferase
MPHPHVSIVVLNWNNWEDTLECLESVYQIQYPNYDVIVVDNASEDDSLKKIESYSKGELKVNSKFIKYNSTNKPLKLVKPDKKNNALNKNYLDSKSLFLIENQENFGYTEGNNAGIRFALNSLNTEFVLILNNDTVVNEKILKNLISSIESPEVAIVQPKILYYDNPNIINTTGNKMDIFGSCECRGCEEIDTGQYDSSYYGGFFIASGACMFIKRNIINKLNKNHFFDPMLFAYHEDVDISFTARVLGFKIAYCPSAICYHKEGRSLKNNYKKFYWAQRNNIRVLIKNYSLKNLLWILPISLFIDLIYSIFSMFYLKRMTYVKILAQSVIWNIKNLKNTLKQRKIIQKQRKTSDCVLINSMEKKSIKLSSAVHSVITKFKE